MKKKTMSILVLIGFIILGIIFLKGRTHELTKILEIDFKYVLPIFLLVVFQSLFRGHKLKILMEFYNIKLRFKEWWGLEMMTEFWNSLIPFKGGMSAKAIYLKKKYQFPFTFFASITGLSFLIDFLGFGVLGVIASFFLPVQEGVKYSLLVFFTLLLIGSIFMLFFLPLPIKTDIRILKHIAQSISELRRVRTNYFFLFKLSLNFLARSLSTATRLYLVFLAFGVHLPLFTCLIIGLFTGISKIISITPMNLGFREAVVITSSKLFSLGTLLGTFVAVVDRAVAFVWVFVAAPICGYALIKDLKIKKEHPNVYISKK